MGNIFSIKECEKSDCSRKVFTNNRTNSRGCYLHICKYPYCSELHLPEKRFCSFHSFKNEYLNRKKY